MTLARPSEHSGGGDFFKPKDLSNALALLFEPRRLLEDQPRTYQGKQTGIGDNVIADITVFENQAQLDNGTPKIMKNVTIEKPGVVNRLREVIGGGMAGVLKLVNTNSGNNAWVLDDLTEDAVWEKVQSYYDARTAAAAAAPSFE